MKTSLYAAICLLRGQGFEMSMKFERAKLENDESNIKLYGGAVKSVDAALEILEKEHSKK